MILSCTCTHPQQDTFHGHSRRVHNETEKKQGTELLYRCSVCSAQRTANSPK